MLGSAQMDVRILFVTDGSLVREKLKLLLETEGF
jgi:hypothetical protein